MLKLDLCAVE